MLDEYRGAARSAVRVAGRRTASRVVKPAGAFYLFPDVSDFLSPDGVRTSAELAQALLDEARVALTPGEAFDAPGLHPDLRTPTSMERLERGRTRSSARSSPSTAPGHAQS